MLHGSLVALQKRMAGEAKDKGAWSTARLTEIVSQDPAVSDLWLFLLALVGHPERRSKEERDEERGVDRIMRLFGLFVDQSGRARSQRFNTMHDDRAVFLHFQGATDSAVELLHRMFLGCSPTTVRRRLRAAAEANQRKIRALMASAAVNGTCADNATWVVRKRMLAYELAYLRSANTVSALMTLPMEPGRPDPEVMRVRRHRDGTIINVTLQDGGFNIKWLEVGDLLDQVFGPAFEVLDQDLSRRYEGTLEKAKLRGQSQQRQELGYDDIVQRTCAGLCKKHDVVVFKHRLTNGLCEMFIYTVRNWSEFSCSHEINAKRKREYKFFVGLLYYCFISLFHQRPPDGHADPQKHNVTHRELMITECLFRGLRDIMQ